MKLNTGNEMPPQLGGKRPKFNIYWVWAAVAVVILSWGLLGSGEVTHPTDWDSVKTMIEQGDVQKIVVVNKETAEVYLKPDKVAEYAGQKDYKGLSAQGPQFAFNIGSLDYFQHNLENTLSERDLSVPLTFETRRNMWSDAFTLIFPILIFFAIWWFLWRGMSRGGGGGSGSGIFNVGKAKAQMFDKDSNVTITFKDVAGLEEAKVEIMEIVDFLKNPGKYRDLGGKIPKGALLVGPPGTGKTLLAKAVAGEANVPFFSISGSDFVEMFVGVGASRVRDLFRQAKEKAPCIVFIDEIDAIGRARSKNAGFSSNDERENTLNQLLTEMDGFGTNAGVIVLAATNRADILDKALLRAGAARSEGAARDIRRAPEESEARSESRPRLFGQADAGFLGSRYRQCLQRGSLDRRAGVTRVRSRRTTSSMRSTVLSVVWSVRTRLLRLRRRRRLPTTRRDMRP